MSSLAVLLLVTPIYGLSLAPPQVSATIDLQVHAAFETPAADDDHADDDDSGDDYVEQMRRRNAIATNGSPSHGSSKDGPPA